jgi:hypothetical protein
MVDLVAVNVVLINTLIYHRGKLRDTILDWEDNLPHEDLLMAEQQSRYTIMYLLTGWEGRTGKYLVQGHWSYGQSAARAIQND